VWVFYVFSVAVLLSHPPRPNNNPTPTSVSKSVATEKSGGIP